MEIINLTGTDETPEVILDKENGRFEFSGKSLPEDVSKFYEPIFNWIAGYKKMPNQKTTVVFKFIYFNTSSSKVILDKMTDFEEIKKTGKDISFQWLYAKSDEDMRDAGTEFSELVSCPIEIIEA